MICVLCEGIMVLDDVVDACIECVSFDVYFHLIDVLSPGGWFYCSHVDCDFVAFAF